MSMWRNTSEIIAGVRLSAPSPITYSPYTKQLRAGRLIAGVVLLAALALLA